MYNLVVMENFGSWLRESRKENRLTQDELAKKSGVSSSYISTLERNQPHSITGAILRPEPDKVKSLAEALGKDVSAALILAGYAPENSKLPPKLAAIGFSELSENDIEKVASYIEFLKSQKGNGK